MKYASEDFAYEIPLPHGVDRIEALGANAVVVGSDGRDLSFTSLRLARYPVAVDGYLRKDPAQGETRSHGFFYKSLGEGLVGLPIIGGGQGDGGQLRKESAALLYLRSETLRPVAVGLRTLQQLDPTGWPILMAGALLMIVPVVLLYLVAQRTVLYTERMSWDD